MVLLLSLFQITQIKPPHTETMYQLNILNSSVTLPTFPSCPGHAEAPGKRSCMGWVQERVGTLTSALGLQKAPASMDFSRGGGGGGGLGTPGGWLQHPGAQNGLYHSGQW